MLEAEKISVLSFYKNKEEICTEINASLKRGIY